MKSVKEIVAVNIAKYKTKNPFEIAEQKGIIVHYSLLKNAFGYHKTFKRVSVICIHSELSNPLRGFVCAHELGHAILHPNMNTTFLRRNTFFPTGKIEKEAHEFALELSLFGEKPEESETIESFLCRNNVPLEMVDEYDRYVKATQFH